MENYFQLKEKNDEKYSHSTKLHSYIDGVLKQQNIDIKDLSAIAVSKGPGILHRFKNWSGCR